MKKVEKKGLFFDFFPFLVKNVDHFGGSERLYVEVMKGGLLKTNMGSLRPPKKKIYSWPILADFFWPQDKQNFKRIFFNKGFLGKIFVSQFLKNFENFKRESRKNFLSKIGLVYPWWFLYVTFSSFFHKKIFFQK